MEKTRPAPTETGERLFGAITFVRGEKVSDAACGMSFLEPYLTAREVRIDAMDAQENFAAARFPT